MLLFEPGLLGEEFPWIMLSPPSLDLMQNQRFQCDTLKRNVY